MLLGVWALLGIAVDLWILLCCRIPSSQRIGTRGSLSIQNLCKLLCFMALTGSSFVFRPANMFIATFLVLLSFWNLAGVRTFAHAQDLKSPNDIPIRPLPKDGYAEFESARPPALLVPEIGIQCSSDNGSHVGEVIITPSLAFEIFARNDVWTCLFRWVHRTEAQNFIVFTPDGEGLPFPCPLKMCFWTIDTSGFNLRKTATEYVHVYGWFA